MLARQLFDSEKLHASEHELNLAGAAVEKSADAQVLLGVIARRTGRTQEAATHLATALEIEPDRYDALTWLASVRQAMNDVSGAAELFERAASINPADATVLTHLGVCRLRLGQAPQAEAAFRATLSLAPTAPQSHFNLGMALRMQNRIEEGLGAFQRALELDPNEPSNYIQVFKQLQQLSRWEEGIACLEQGLRRHSQSSLLAEALASAFGRVGGKEKAEEIFRRFSSEASIVQAYADWLQQEGRFEDSMSVLEESIASRPLQGPAYRLLAEAKAFQIGDESLIDKIQAIIDRPEIDERDRMHLAYALGKAYDAAGDYQSAMRSLDMANELAFRIYPVVQTFDPEGPASETRATQELFTPGLMTRLGDKGSPSDRPIFIVGMIRSGTTLLDQILSSHPEVSSAGEQPFWNVEAGRVRGALRADPDRVDLGSLTEQYLSVLSALDPNSPHVIDKMPLNFRHLGLIHLAFPRAKIVHIRRHPVDTCLSIYSMFFGGGPNFAYDRENIVAFYRAYLRLMEHWRTVLPPESLFELDYEELVVDREPVIRSAVQFCGLPWDDACLRHEENAGSIATPSRWQARQPIYQSSSGRWRRYEPYLGAFAHLLDSESQGPSQKAQK